MVCNGGGFLTIHAESVAMSYPLRALIIYSNVGLVTFPAAFVVCYVRALIPPNNGNLRRK